jgi:hypothetical protein
MIASDVTQTSKVGTEIDYNFVVFLSQVDISQRNDRVNPMMEEYSNLNAYYKIIV